MKKAMAILMTLSLMVCGFAFAEGAQLRYSIEDDGNALRVALPEGESWEIYTTDEGAVLKPGADAKNAEGAMQSTFVGVENASGYATIIAHDAATDEAHALTIRIGADGRIEVVQEGYADALPIDAPMIFEHSSGVGAWMTELTLKPDGSFTGTFHDSDMGDADETYPEGTVYNCSFSGKFGNIYPVGETMYAMSLIELNAENDEEYIADGMRFVPSDPAGLTEGLYAFCLPGTPVEAMNEEALFWWIDRPEEPETITAHALYQMGTGEAFYAE